MVFSNVVKCDYLTFAVKDDSTLEKVVSLFRGLGFLKTSRFREGKKWLTVKRIEKASDLKYRASKKSCYGKAFEYPFYIASIVGKDCVDLWNDNLIVLDDLKDDIELLRLDLKIAKEIEKEVSDSWTQNFLINFKENSDSGSFLYKDGITVYFSHDVGLGRFYQKENSKVLNFELELTDEDFLKEIWDGLKKKETEKAKKLSLSRFTKIFFNYYHLLKDFRNIFEKEFLSLREELFCLTENVDFEGEKESVLNVLGVKKFNDNFLYKKGNSDGMVSLVKKKKVDTSLLPVQDAVSLEKEKSDIFYRSENFLLFFFFYVKYKKEKSKDIRFSATEICDFFFVKDTQHRRQSLVKKLDTFFSLFFFEKKKDSLKLSRLLISLELKKGYNFEAEINPSVFLLFEKNHSPLDLDGLQSFWNILREKQGKEKDCNSTLFSELTLWLYNAIDGVNSPYPGQIPTPNNF